MIQNAVMSTPVCKQGWYGKLVKYDQDDTSSKEM